MIASQQDTAGLQPLEISPLSPSALTECEFTAWPLATRRLRFSPTLSLEHLAGDRGERGERVPSAADTLALLIDTHTETGAVRERQRASEKGGGPTRSPPYARACRRRAGSVLRALSLSRAHALSVGSRGERWTGLGVWWRWQRGMASDGAMRYVGGSAP